MKILTKNKIIEAFHFPITEALAFSILLWTTWGLAESFYWDRLSRVFHMQGHRIDSFLYLQAFFIYVGIAAFLASVIYVGTRILMAAFHQHNPRIFRALTLCSILAVFYLAAFVHCFRGTWWSNQVGSTRYLIFAALLVLAIALLVLLYRWASGPDFRIRRSGTMMLSILVISIVLSFVPFPIFFQESDPSGQNGSYGGYRKLMAYQYLAPLLGS
jgi:hypothetical protein